jgi:2-iminoacetate synthase ThiH
MATGYNQLRAIAVGRLILDNLARVRGSWAALTESMMQVAFWYGADDAGSAILPGEDVPESLIGQEQLEELIRETGRDPIERMTSDE